MDLNGSPRLLRVSTRGPRPAALDTRSLPQSQLQPSCLPPLLSLPLIHCSAHTHTSPFFSRSLCSRARSSARQRRMKKRSRTSSCSTFAGSRTRRYLDTIFVSSQLRFRYDFVTILQFRYDFVTTPIRFIRPSLSLVFPSFVYVEGEIWSNETDGNRNLSSDLFRLVTMYL